MRDAAARQSLAWSPHHHPLSWPPSPSRSTRNPFCPSPAATTAATATPPAPTFGSTTITTVRSAMRQRRLHGVAYAASSICLASAFSSSPALILLLPRHRRLHLLLLPERWLAGRHYCWQHHLLCCSRRPRLLVAPPPRSPGRLPGRAAVHHRCDGTRRESRGG